MHIGKLEEEDTEKVMDGVKGFLIGRGLNGEEGLEGEVHVGGVCFLNIF